MAESSVFNRNALGTVAVFFVLIVPSLCMKNSDKTTSPSQSLSSRESIQPRTTACATGDMCVLELRNPFPKPQEKPRGIKFHSNKNLCQDPAEHQDSALSCCEAMSRQIASFIRETNLTVVEILEKVGCNEMYCSKDSCGHLGCEIPDTPCEEAMSAPTGRQSPASKQGNSHSQSSSSNASSNGNDDKGPDVILITISCVLAFLAGIGGAVLVTWLCRRHRSTKESPQFLEGRRGEELSMKSMKTSPTSTSTNQPHQRLSSDNDYSYISDFSINGGLARSHAPVHRMTSSTYNEPNDPLASRELPAPPVGDARSLAENGSRDRRGNNSQLLENQSRDRKGNRSQAPSILSAYSLARQPECGMQSERGGSSSSSFVAQDRPYFILEREGSTFGSNGSARELIPPEAARGRGYYSSLNAGYQSGEDYTPLGEGVTAPDYLELIPDYSLQRPVH